MSLAEGCQPGQELGRDWYVPREFDVTSEAGAVKEIDGTIADHLVGDVGVPHGDIAGLGSFHAEQSVGPIQCCHRVRSAHIAGTDSPPCPFEPCSTFPAVWDTQNPLSIGTLRGGGSALHGEQFPGPRHPFEFVLATIAELDTRPDNEVLDGPRNEDLSRSRQRSHPGGDVHGQSAEVIASDLALARVQPHRSSIPSFPVASLMARAQRMARAGPSNEATKPSPVVLISLPRKPPELFAHRPVMGVKQRAPPLVAERCGLCSGADDVGEEHGGEDALDLDVGPLAGQELGDIDARGRRPSSVSAWKLDEGRSLYVIGEITAVCER